MLIKLVECNFSIEETLLKLNNFFRAYKPISDYNIIIMSGFMQDV